MCNVSALPLPFGVVRYGATVVQNGNHITTYRLLPFCLWFLCRRSHLIVSRDAATKHISTLQLLSLHAYKTWDAQTRHTDTNATHSASLCDGGWQQGQHTHTHTYTAHRNCPFDEKSKPSSPPSSSRRSHLLSVREVAGWGWLFLYFSFCNAAHCTAKGFINEELQLPGVELHGTSIVSCHCKKKPYQCPFKAHFITVQRFKAFHQPHNTQCSWDVCWMCCCFSHYLPHAVSFRCSKIHTIRKVFCWNNTQKHSNALLRAMILIIKYEILQIVWFYM